MCIARQEKGIGKWTNPPEFPFAKGGLKAREKLDMPSIYCGTIFLTTEVMVYLLFVERGNSGEALERFETHRKWFDAHHKWRGWR